MAARPSAPPFLFPRRVPSLLSMARSRPWEAPCTLVRFPMVPSQRGSNGAFASWPCRGTTISSSWTARAALSLPTCCRCVARHRPSHVLPLCGEAPPVPRAAAVWRGTHFSHAVATPRLAGHLGHCCGGPRGRKSGVSTLGRDARQRGRPSSRRVPHEHVAGRFWRRYRHLRRQAGGPSPWGVEPRRRAAAVARRAGGWGVNPRRRRWCGR
jgi:hypothetical protein